MQAQSAPELCKWRGGLTPVCTCGTAIGVGGDGFAASMRSAVEGVLGHVHEESVSLRPSSAGKYVSVTVGPVTVESGDQARPVCCTLLSDYTWFFLVTTYFCRRSDGIQRSHRC